MLCWVWMPQHRSRTICAGWALPQFPLQHCPHCGSCLMDGDTGIGAQRPGSAAACVARIRWFSSFFPRFAVRDGAPKGGGDLATAGTHSIRPRVCLWLSSIHNYLLLAETGSTWGQAGPGLSVCLSFPIYPCRRCTVVCGTRRCCAALVMLSASSPSVTAMHIPLLFSISR